MMPTTPCVTVLMAVHNGIPYLPAAIDSVLAQTFADFEFLIVDDGSTDATAACARSYGDARIRLVSNASRLGQTGSLNVGLGLARGSYIARLDADDVCLPERLQRQVAFLDGHDDVVLLGTWMYELDARGRRARVFGETLGDYGTWVARLLTGHCPVYHSSSMCRREAVACVGGYDEQFRIGQDYDLWIRLALRRGDARVLPEPLTMYRVHERQQTIADEERHRAELRLAHDHLVEAFCPAGQARRVARLLRADDRLWDDCAVKADIGAAVAALGETLERLRATLQLSRGEYSALRRCVLQRIGPGMRLAPRLIHCPSWVFYAGVGLLSPLFIPRVRHTLARANRWRRHRRLGVVMEGGRSA